MQERSVQSLFDLSGKTVLISGASGYLGSAMSRALAEAGARLVVTSRDPDRANETAATLREKLGGDHLGVSLDQMDHSTLEESFQRAVEMAGSIDVVVNNGHEGNAKDLTNVTAEEFDRQLKNATGYFLMARCLRDHVVSRGVSGNVVMIGSMYGMVASYPDAYAGICAASPVAYHTLKGGIVHLTRHLAAYWAEDRIRVNCLSPGPFPNPDTAPQEMVNRLCNKLPMRRMGVNHELKGVIVFLASDASSYVTGHNLVVDGGWTAW